MDQKDLITGWLKLYNLLNGTSYTVINWPDEKERRCKDIDALCQDSSGSRLAVEHTLIQPFMGAKEDDSRFFRTLADLEDNPALIVPGFTIHVSQPVGAVPKGIQWEALRQDILNALAPDLPSLPPGASQLDMFSQGITIPVTVWKNPVELGEVPTFKTGRIWPGDPGPDLILTALRTKIPKLARYHEAKKLLLLEKDAIAGTVESQFERLPNNSEIQRLLRQIDTIWGVNTAGTFSAPVIFSNDIWPTIRTRVGSLDLSSGEFWQRPN